MSHAILKYTDRSMRCVGSSRRKVDDFSADSTRREDNQEAKIDGIFISIACGWTRLQVTVVLFRRLPAQPYVTIR